MASCARVREDHCIPDGFNVPEKGSGDVDSQLHSTASHQNSMLFVAILPFLAKNICHCFRLLMSIAKHIFVSILVTASYGLLLNLFLHSIFCLHASVSFNLCRRNHHRSQGQSSRHVTPGHHTRRRATSSLVVAEARDPRRTGGKPVRPAAARHNPSVNLAWVVSEPLRLLEHRAWSSSPRLKLVLCASVLSLAVPPFSFLPFSKGLFFLL